MLNILIFYEEQISISDLVPKNASLGHKIDKESIR